MELLFIAGNNRPGPEIETVSMAMAEPCCIAGYKKWAEPWRSHPVKPGSETNGTYLRPYKQESRHASESWHPESAYGPMHFQYLDSGIRRNDGVKVSFTLKQVPIGPVPFL